MMKIENLVAVGLAVLSLSACTSGTSGQEPATPAPVTMEPVPSDVGNPTHAEAGVLVQAARADSLRDSYSEADVAFITHMIPHHAQALVMARLVPDRAQSPALRVLAGRIINAQNDEIAIMQGWLRDRGLPVPDPEHAMHGGHHMQMPGMLTPEQLARLEAARGVEFDRLFLEFMIQHHEGARAMVFELIETPGGAQGDAIFKIASEINVDQETEIDRMRLMLRDLVLGS